MYFYFILAPENNKAQEGSSFESASSLYSSTRTDNMIEDLVVPSLSPPLQLNDNDFKVPNLSSPPLPLPERLSRAKIEKIDLRIAEKLDISQTNNSSRREKTDIKKPKEDKPKTVNN